MWIALLCAGSMWYYVQRVLVPYEKADSAAHQRPRGNLSDLYPRWLGSRELLLHHRNPYGSDITTEIQKGYYGRELDPARPDDPKDRQGFAYPLYVVFLLAPLIGFPFHGVQIFFHWLLVGLTAASVWLWLRVLRWELPLMAVAACVALTLGSFPAVQGIKLQQLSLLVAALLAGSVACVASGSLFLGGVLLALATIKPQLAWPLVAWLLLWAASDWRARRKFVFGFGLMMALLLAGAEIILPGWWRMFAGAIGQYHQYTQNQSVIEVMLNEILGSAAGGSMSRVGRADSRGDCYSGLRAAVMEVATRASGGFRIHLCHSACARFDCTRDTDVRTLQPGSSAAGNAAAGTGAGSVCVAVARPPFGIRLGRTSFGMAVGGKPRPHCSLLAGFAGIGARWLAVAVFCDLCLAGVDVRADFLLCAGRAAPSPRGRQVTGIRSGRAQSTGNRGHRVDDVSLIASTEDRGWRPWRRAVVLALFLRLIYSFFAATVALIQPVNWRLAHSNAFTENLRPPDHSLRYLLLGVWERFDALWYLHIAAHGYDRPDAVVFFPMYPSLLKIMTLLVPPMVAALLISTTAAFFLFWGLHELLLGEGTPDLANQSVFLCAVWPASFIFFAGYPESLLLALIVWSLCMARRRRWLAAAALGLAAALTKAVGVVVVVPLMIMALRRGKIKALPILLVPFGLAGFLGYQHLTGHGALASAYGLYWRTTTSPPWTTLWAGVYALVHTPDPILVLNVIFLLLVSVLATRSRLKIEYLLYSAAAIVFFLSKNTTPPLQSMLRYLLIVFPAFAGFAQLLQRPHFQPRFGMVCLALFVINLGLLWLFLGWSLVL